MLRQPYQNNFKWLTFFPGSLRIFSPMEHSDAKLNFCSNRRSNSTTVQLLIFVIASFNFRSSIVQVSLNYCSTIIQLLFKHRSTTAQLLFNYQSTTGQLLFTYRSTSVQLPFNYNSTSNQLLFNNHFINIQPLSSINLNFLNLNSDLYHCAASSILRRFPNLMIY